MDLYTPKECSTDLYLDHSRFMILVLLEANYVYKIPLVQVVTIVLSTLVSPYGNAGPTLIGRTRSVPAQAWQSLVRAARLIRSLTGDT